jgi:tRNA(adenine34) deaminase
MMCATAIGWAQFEQLVYGAPDPKKGFTLFSPSPLHPKTIIQPDIMADECGAIVQAFFQKRRKL